MKGLIKKIINDILITHCELDIKSHLIDRYFRAI